VSGVATKIKPAKVAASNTNEAQPAMKRLADQFLIPSSEQVSPLSNDRLKTYAPSTKHNANPNISAATTTTAMLPMHEAMNRLADHFTVLFPKLPSSTPCDRPQAATYDSGIALNNAISRFTGHFQIVPTHFTQNPFHNMSLKEKNQGQSHPTVPTVSSDAPNTTQDVATWVVRHHGSGIGVDIGNNELTAESRNGYTSTVMQGVLTRTTQRLDSESFAQSIPISPDLTAHSSTLRDMQTEDILGGQESVTDHDESAALSAGEDHAAAYDRRNETVPFDSLMTQLEDRSALIALPPETIVSSNFVSNSFGREFTGPQVRLLQEISTRATDEDTIVVKKAKLELKVKEMRILFDPHGWLNDEVVNGWFVWCNDSKSPAQWVNTNTFFWKKVQERSSDVYLKWFRVSGLVISLV
jgi:hypothetical protein